LRRIFKTGNRRRINHYSVYYTTEKAAASITFM